VVPSEPLPRPRSAPAPEELLAPVETLPGVGPAVRRKLLRLGVATVGDVLALCPRRYERPVAERTIADLFGD
jgi:RecG-like helicase